MGRLFGQLLQLRGEVRPWQQQAIGHIGPTLESLAVRTEAAIRHVEGDRDPGFAPEYQEHVSAIAHASRAAVR